MIYFHKGLSKREQALIESKEQQEREAKRLLGEAQKSGERQKHELLLEAKEEIHKSRLELEKSVRDRKSELQRERNRIEQKEESLDSKLANVEQQRDDLSQQLAEVEEMKEQARLQEEKIFSELERISGLTVEEARTVVLDSAREEYRHDMAVMYKQMEDETKVSADIMAQDIIATAIHRYSADYVSESTVTVVTLPTMI